MKFRELVKFPTVAEALAADGAFQKAVRLQRASEAALTNGLRRAADLDAEAAKCDAERGSLAHAERVLAGDRKAVKHDRSLLERAAELRAEAQAIRSAAPTVSEGTARGAAERVRQARHDAMASRISRLSEERRDVDAELPALSERIAALQRHGEEVDRLVRQAVEAGHIDQVVHTSGRVAAVREHILTPEPGEAWPTAKLLPLLDALVALTPRATIEVHFRVAGEKAGQVNVVFLGHGDQKARPEHERVARLLRDFDEGRSLDLHGLPQVAPPTPTPAGARHDTPAQPQPASAAVPEGTRVVQFPGGFRRAELPCGCIDSYMALAAGAWSQTKVKACAEHEGQRPDGSRIRVLAAPAPTETAPAPEAEAEAVSA